MCSLPVIKLLPTQNQTVVFQKKPNTTITVIYHHKEHDPAYIVSMVLSSNTHNIVPPQVN